MTASTQCIARFLALLLLLMLYRWWGTISKDCQGILNHGVEHLNESHNYFNPSDSEFVDCLPTLPLMPDFDTQPSFEEVISTTEHLKKNKAVGPNCLQEEMFKYGGGQKVNHHLHHFLFVLNFP